MAAILRAVNRTKSQFRENRKNQANNKGSLSDAG